MSASVLRDGIRQGVRGFLIWSLLLLVAAPGEVLADNVQPAYLDIEEFEPGAFNLVWKVPLNQKVPAGFEPVFPATCRLSSKKKGMKTAGTLIGKWSMVCDPKTLDGVSLRIAGLKETILDTLVRIERADGSSYRTVLRPTETSMTIPSSKPTDGGSGAGVLSFLRGATYLPYTFVFLAALLFSFTPRARKRGIILCSLALIVGSLSGHALGQLPLREKLFGVRTLSEAEAKRVLQGLMLNTYRAFVLDKEEETYDVLARSVDGEFLNEVYLQNKLAMRIGGADEKYSIVDRLDVKSIEAIKPLEDGALAITANWDVYGSVSHWNHIHFRCNTYQAEVTLVPAGNYWKLTRVQLIDQERVI